MIALFLSVLIVLCVVGLPALDGIGQVWARRRQDRSDLRRLR